MSWHFSRALVEEYLAGCSSGGELSARLKSIHMQSLYSSSARTMEFCRRSRSGMTCGRLTGRRGVELLTWFLEVSRARTSPSPGKGLESMVKRAGCGLKCVELSVRFCPSLSSWKTHQCLFTEVLPESSVTLPRWGTMQNGVVSQAIIPAGKRMVKGCGWLRRPLWTDHKFYVLTRQQMLTRRRQGKTPMNWMQQAIELSDLKKAWANVRFAEHLLRWPINWTDLRSLEMGRIQRWLKLHGNV